METYSNLQRSGGEALYNICTEIWEHPQRGANWNPHGLTVVPNMKYQVATENKIIVLKVRIIHLKKHTKY